MFFALVSSESLISQESTTAPVNISVVVFDSQTNLQRISNALVYFYNSSTTIYPSRLIEQRYEFNNLIPGKYALRAEFQEKVILNPEINILPEQVNGIGLFFDENLVSVGKGNISILVKKAPILDVNLPNASLFLKDKFGVSYRVDLGNPTHNFFNLPIGEYSLTANLQGYKNYTHSQIININQGNSNNGIIIFLEEENSTNNVTPPVSNPEPAPSSGGGGGGGGSGRRSGGGGGGSCSTNWTCTSWSSCSEGNQTRTCNKIAPNCIALQKPIEVQSCFMAVYSNESIVEEKEESTSRGFFGITGQSIRDFASSNTGIFGLILIICLISGYALYAFLEKENSKLEDNVGEVGNSTTLAKEENVSSPVQEVKEEKEKPKRKPRKKVVEDKDAHNYDF
jgi:uncharacterized membrane protein YgcG